MPLIVRGNILQSRGRVDWLPDGNVTQPALTFVSDTDTGFYRVSDDDIAISTGGVSRLRLNSDGASLAGNLTTTGNVTITGNLDVTGFVTGQGLAADLSISNVQVADSEWNVVDDTHVGLTEGYILVNGAGFAPGSMVQVGGTNAAATSYVSSTQLRAQTPAKSSGTYDITVIRGDTKTATIASAVSYSDAVTWVTTSPLDAVYQYLPFATTLQATSDSNVVYANTTALPTSVTLNSSTGVLDGNILTGNADTLYSFDVKAEDEELQDAVRTFLMQYYPFAAGKISASDTEASAYFGYSCAVSADGTRVVVGAYSDDATGGADSGACYVFSRSGGSWVQETKLIPSDSEASAYFGWSCAIDSAGSRVVVGAYSDDATGGADSGACYVFSRSGTSWSEETKLIASDSEANAQFGWSCAIDSTGTRLVMGARHDDATGGADSGAAYVFSRSGTTWSEESKLVASDSEASAWLGYSCAISGDGTRVVVGARHDAAAGGANSGAAYVFSRSGTSWSEESKLVPSDSEASARFGQSCAIDSTGSRVVVGAYLDDAAGGADSGAAYVFSRSDTTWSEESKLIASDSEAGAQFARSCAIDSAGSRVVVGASHDDATGGADSGACYVFSRSGTSWSEDTKLVPSDSENGAQFGFSCAIDSTGSLVVAGAPYDDAGATNAGAAYLFQRTYVGWKETWP